MLTPKENFLETIKRDGKPDRLVNQYEDMTFFPVTPVSAYVRGKRYKGMAPLKDKFGTEVVWPDDQPAATPHITDENKVIKDLANWREELEIPDLMGNCSDPALWEQVRADAEKVRAEGKLSMVLVPTGVFEQMHFLTGFEDLFVGMVTEEEAVLDFARAIGRYRYDFMKLIIDLMKPDILLSHDDWGSKNSLFMSPDMWRTFIKPQYADIYRYAKEKGVIVIHHSDSFLEPIVEDMAELGVDVWQGVLPSNNILALQKQLGGRMALMGGLDSGIVDRVDSTEEEIRTEVRRACETYGPGGHFIPCITYGGPGTIFPNNDPFITDEINRYNVDTYGFSS